MNRHGIPHIRRHLMSRRQPNVYAVVLFLQLIDRIAALDPKPPVTLFLIAFNLSIFYFRQISGYLSRDVVSLLRPVMAKFTVRNGCLQPIAVMSGQRLRLLTASFIHLSDLHVLYNCTSLLYKGVALEAGLGSLIFFALVVYLAFIAHAFYVAIALAAHHFGYPNVKHNCTAGFSGVLFGLKVVLNANPQYGHIATNVFGVPIPGGVAPWAELFYTSALMPNVSFLGHLCGILAGITYVVIPKLIAYSIIPLVRRSYHSFTFRPFQGRPRHLHYD